MRRLFALALSAALVSGCAGISPTQAGQTAGTIAGAALIPGIGAPIGALAGMLVGILIQGHVDKVTERQERHALGEELRTGRAQPTTTAQAELETVGTPTRVWVDETMKDGRLIAGHFDVRNLQ